MVENWVWETGLARLGRSHLQGSSLLVASIQGRKLGWTFSTHPVKNLHSDQRKALPCFWTSSQQGGFAFPSWLCLCQQHTFTLDFLQPLHGPLLCLDCRRMRLSPPCTQGKPAPTSQDNKACKWDSNPATCLPACRTHSRFPTLMSCSLSCFLLISSGCTGLAEDCARRQGAFPVQW